MSAADQLRPLRAWTDGLEDGTVDLVDGCVVVESHEDSYRHESPSTD